MKDILEILGEPAKPRTLQDRFWAKVYKTEGCWLWVGSTVDWRYGQIFVEGRLRLAHRVSWELHFGPIPEGMCVCHHCDNGLCVRPDHLFLGTQWDNLQDASDKDRKGKLTWEQVGAIREEYEQRKGVWGAQTVLAEKYGVAPRTISSIIRYESWNDE